MQLEQGQVPFQMGMVDHHILVAEAWAQAAEEEAVVPGAQQAVAQKDRKRLHLLGRDIQLEQELDTLCSLVPCPTGTPQQAVVLQALELDFALDRMGMQQADGRPCLHTDSIVAGQLPFGSQKRVQKPQNWE